MKHAAEKMIYDTARKLPHLYVGDIIFLNVPKMEEHYRKTS